jgi:hypothetical protein
MEWKVKERTGKARCLHKMLKAGKGEEWHGLACIGVARQGHTQHTQGWPRRGLDGMGQDWQGKVIPDAQGEAMRGSEGIGWQWQGRVATHQILRARSGEARTGLERRVGEWQG